MNKLLLSVFFVSVIATNAHAESYKLIGKIDNNSINFSKISDDKLYVIRSNDLSPNTTLDIYDLKANLKLIKTKNYKLKSTISVIDDKNEYLYLAKDNQIKKIRMRDSLNTETIDLDPKSSIKSLSLCDSQGLMMVGNANYSANLFKKDKNNKYQNIFTKNIDYSRVNNGFIYSKFSPTCDTGYFAGDDNTINVLDIKNKKITQSITNASSPIFFAKDKVIYNTPTGITIRVIKTGKIFKLAQSAKNLFFKNNTTLIYDLNNEINVYYRKIHFKLKTDYKNPITDMKYEDKNGILLLNSNQEKDLLIYSLTP